MLGRELPQTAEAREGLEKRLAVGAAQVTATLDKVDRTVPSGFLVLNQAVKFGSRGETLQMKLPNGQHEFARLSLLVRERGRYELPAVDPLLDAFLRDYCGPGGSQRFAYTLDPPCQFAAKATDILGRAMAPDTFAISADVGPDLLSSWRKPTHVVVYASESIALDSLGLVGARGREDANVLLRMPTDAPVFATLAVRAAGPTAIPLVDVPQMMWDLLDLGGEDREEAAGRLREWFIQHRQMS